jgi:uncharacterized membrane protein (UPF0136 family)
MHPRALSALLVLAVGAGLAAAAALRSPIRVDGLIMAAAVLLYLLAVHAFRLPKLPKELLVAVLFTAGTALAPWVRSAGAPALLLPTAALGVLCWLNLVGIEANECERAAGSTVWGARHLRVLAAGAGLLGLQPGIAAVAAGLIAWRSALPRLGRESARVLADVPLLLPALFWVGS